MRTTLDLPDDVLKRAKIEAVGRGSTLRQLVIDAPLRRLSPEAVKQLDEQAVRQADERKPRALHR